MLMPPLYRPCAARIKKIYRLKQQGSEINICYGTGRAWYGSAFLAVVSTRAGGVGHKLVLLPASSEVTEGPFQNTGIRYTALPFCVYQ